MEKNKEINDNLEQDSVDSLLANAEKSIVEAISCRAMKTSVENFENIIEAYESLRYSVSADDLSYNLGETGNESVDILIDAAKRSMFVQYKGIMLEEKYCEKKQMELFALAFASFQRAVEVAKTKKELERCADSIEMQLYDKKWADEIRREIYPDTWTPAENQSLETELANSSKSYNKLMGLEETKNGIGEYYKDRMPAAYAEYLKKNREE